MSNEILFMIIGMGIVTYIPRMLPFVLLKGIDLPPFLQGVLRNVPYATLGALIFPGILFMNEHILCGVVGGVIAVIVAYLGANIIVVVLSAIAFLTAFSYFL